MKPVNSAQRRKAFLSYLLVFVITLLPICLSIYLYGRVDHAENDFLREKYRRSQQIQEVKYSESRIYNSLNQDIISVENQITQSQAIAVTSPESGNIEPKISALKRSLREVDSELSGEKLNATEAQMLEMIRTQAECLEKMNGIYRSTFQKLRDEREEVEKLQDRLNAAGITY